jgi:hypothetical protein
LKIDDFKDIHFFLYELTERHAAQAPALRERLPPINNHKSVAFLVPVFLFILKRGLNK